MIVRGQSVIGSARERKLWRAIIACFFFCYIWYFSWYSGHHHYKYVMEFLVHGFGGIVIVSSIPEPGIADSDSIETWLTITEQY